MFIFTPLGLARQVKGAAFYNAVKKIPIHVLKMPIGEIEERLNLTEVDFKIKNNFWDQFFRAYGSDQKIDPKKIYRNVCTYTNFYNNVLGNPYRLTRIIHPMSHADDLLRVLANISMSKMEEIVNLEIKNPNGEPNLKSMDTFLKAFKVIDESMSRIL